MEPDVSLTRFGRDLHCDDAARRDEAARQIWQQFAGRLGGVVRRRLDARILRRAGEEDILQSLFAGFFAAAPGPEGPPKNRAELWGLLVRFTMCKVANTANHYRAQRRDLFREQLLPNDVPDESDTGGLKRGELEDVHWLRPEDQAIAREEFDRLLAFLPADLQYVFMQRLDGYTNSEIAALIDRSERMVELKLQTIRSLLRPHIEL